MSKRITLCTIKNGEIHNSFWEGIYDHSGGLKGAIEDAKILSLEGKSFNKNVDDGVGVAIFPPNNSTGKLSILLVWFDWNGKEHYQGD